MITTLIICLTVVFCVVWTTLWIKHMVVRNLPMFTYGECTWKEESPKLEANPIGFAPEEEETKSKEQTEKEKKEAVLADPITMTAALLRGEVDIDDIIN